MINFNFVEIRNSIMDEAIEAINGSLDQYLIAHFVYRILPCPGAALIEI